MIWKNMKKGNIIRVYFRGGQGGTRAFAPLRVGFPPMSVLLDLI